MTLDWGTRQVTIVGMGLTGLSCARYFNAQRRAFRVVDSRESPPLFDQFAAEFPTVSFECGAFDNSSFGGNDVLVVSPGMALSEPAIVDALQQGAQLTSDIEIFVGAIDRPVVAITGSNGKSTVTTLVGEMLNHAGLRACVAGNIGRPVLEQLLEDERADVYVLELSSFQLERLRSLGAEIATVLNVTEDHMDRYDSMADYQAAKWRVFEGATSAVVNRADATTAVPIDALDDAPETTIEYGLQHNIETGFGLALKGGQDFITFNGDALLACDALKIKGRHNQLNVMAALALCLPFDVSMDALVEAAIEFGGLPHRCEYVASIDNVAFYNDSKATNVGAAIAAIDGLTDGKQNLILIAGGLDKNSDFSPLAETAKNSVKHTVLLGVDAGKIAEALDGQPVVRVETLNEAVQASLSLAEKGDLVLFAPACASFDMFENYEARGDAFKEAVHLLEQGGQA